MCPLFWRPIAALCVQCDMWINEEKMVTTKFARSFAHRKCKWNIGEAVEQEEKWCDEVETAKEHTYLGDRVSAGGGCEAAVTVRTGCGWVVSRVGGLCQGCVGSYCMERDIR